MAKRCSFSASDPWGGLKFRFRRALAALALVGLAVVLAGLARPGLAYAPAQETSTPLALENLELETPQPVTATAQPPSATPTRTLIPADYLQTNFQSTGLIFGAVVLVIVIVGGTLFAIRRGEK